MTPDEVFRVTVDFTIEHETGGDPTGAYHVDPNDPGGATKWGICKQYWPDLDVEHMSREQAVALYHKAYWDALGCSSLKPALAAAVFESAVLPGQGFAARARDLVKNRPHPARDMLVERIKYFASRPNFARYGSGWVARTLDCYRLCWSLAEKE